MIELRSWIARAGICAVYGTAVLPAIALAALGEPEASVQADGEQIRGSIKITQRTGYRVHEIDTPSGTLVREFVGPDGTVFALAWNGPRMPNLRQTLGRYFAAYVAASQTKHADHNHLSIAQSDLNIQASGHMRAFSGRAYLPQAVPAGVALEEIQ